MRVVGLRKPFAMATPDYLEQVVISGRRRSSASGAQRVSAGIFHRPSVASLIWATLDLITVAIAALLAVCFRVCAPRGLGAPFAPPFLFLPPTVSLAGCGGGGGRGAVFPAPPPRPPGPFP